MPDLSSFAPKDFISLGLLILAVLCFVLFFSRDEDVAHAAFLLLVPFLVAALVVNVKM